MRFPDDCETREDALHSECVWYDPSRQTAFRKGALAHHEGKGIEVCPYHDHRNAKGRITFARSWIRVWRYGWKCSEGAAAQGLLPAPLASSPPLA